MITRVVRMTFREEEVDTFVSLFNEVSKKIRSFDGCTYLKLMKDHHQPNIYVTYSKWESQINLDNYRQSELFEKTWEATKALFSEKPLAFSLEEFSGEIDL